MVKMMKWMAWPPLSSKKYQAKIVVECLHGMQNNYEGLCVEIEWRGCRNKSNNNNNKRIKKKESSVIKRDVTNEGLLKGDDVVEWNEEFVGVCDFVEFRDLWEVGFIVFNGLNQGPKRRDHAVATGSLNLAEFASLEQEKAQINIHLSVPNSTNCCPILSVLLSLQEPRTANDTTELAGFRKIKIFKIISANRAKKGFREEEGSYGNSSVRTEDADYPFDTDSLEGTDGNDSEDVDYDDSNIKKSLSYGSLASYFNSRGSEDRIYYKSFNIQSYSTKDAADDLNATTINQSNNLVLKRGIFPWRKRKLSFRVPKAKGEPLLKRNVGEEGGDDIDFDRRMLTSSDDSSYGWHRSEDGSTTSRSSFSEFGDDNFVVGKWDTKEVISRDGHMKLQTQVFFASIDQRSERASGESACTSLVTIIADWFQNNRHQMPIQSELDTLIREGSFEWRNLCENELYRKRFPDKHFDLETVLEAKTRNLVVVPEKSFIGFFQPNGLQEGVFDFLDGAMSFDTIWDEISEIGSNHSNNIDPLVYIVSWNDHFFILKVEKDAYYIIDTLGERLYEGCNQAYILKFDQDTTIQRKSNDKLDKSSFSENKKEEFMVSKGKESCKEYIKSFLSAVPLRDLQADVKKGLIAASSPLVHHRLQIEFHYTKCL